MKFTASAVPRLLRCPTSAVLPHHDYRTVDADAGVEGHAEMEEAAESGDVGKLPDIVQSFIDEGSEVYPELAFAYDVATGQARALGRVDRDYGALAPFEIPGTADLVIVGRRLVIADYKRFLEVDPADENAQTLTYALMAARHFGYDEATVAIVYLGGLRAPSVAEVGAFDLDAHAETLKQLHADVLRAASNPQPNPGTWCRFCPAFLSCPAQQELQLALTNGTTALQVEAQMPFGDDESAANAVELLDRVNMVAKRLRAAVYARAAEKPIPLRGGGYLGTVIKPGNEKLDGDTVHAVLEERHGRAIADAAVVRSASKKRIKEALAFTGNKVAVEERAVLADVRARGGAKRETRSVVEVYGQQLASGDLALASGDE